MTTTKALMKLYKVITGQESRNSAAKIISDLADNWSSSNELPAVSSTNNGKVLKVSSGKWAIGTDDNTTYSAATADALGLVKQGVAVADAAGDAPTAAEFKALLDSLRTAGVIASAE